MLEKHHIIQEIPMDISEIIQSHYDSLTKKQRLIADYILENPMEVSYISLSDLSGKTGCSELTVLKFCKALGFTGFIDLKKAFRTCFSRSIDSTLFPAPRPLTSFRSSSVPSLE